MTAPIILAVCREHMITPEEFFGKRRTRRLSSARKMAIELLRARGMSLRACARLIKRDYSIVYYWLHPEARDRKRATMRRYRSKLAVQMEWRGLGREVMV